MPNSDLIRGGTASVAAGATAVTGQGVSWSNVLEGDFFGAHVGLAVPITAIAGSTITLAYPWPGPAQNAAPYAIQPKGDAVRFATAVRELLVLLSDGDLAAIAALPTAADTLAYFTGPGTAALTSLPAAARNFLANFTPPVARSGGVGMVDRVVRIGWSGEALLAQVDTLELGKVWTDNQAARSIAQSGYQKLPSGLIIQWGYTQAASISFPVAFPSAVLALTTQIVADNSDVVFTSTVTASNRAGFNVRKSYISNGQQNSASDPIFWFAIGV